MILISTSTVMRINYPYIFVQTFQMLQEENSTHFLSFQVDPPHLCLNCQENTMQLTTEINSYEPGCLGVEVGVA